jgi:hypothetical protein
LSFESGLFWTSLISINIVFKWDSALDTLNESADTDYFTFFLSLEY